MNSAWNRFLTRSASQNFSAVYLPAVIADNAPLISGAYRPENTSSACDMSIRVVSRGSACNHVLRLFGPSRSSYIAIGSPRHARAVSQADGGGRAPAAATAAVPSAASVGARSSMGFRSASGKALRHNPAFAIKLRVRERVLLLGPQHMREQPPAREGEAGVRVALTHQRENLRGPVEKIIATEVRPGSVDDTAGLGVLGEDLGAFQQSAHNLHARDTEHSPVDAPPG
eukprot:1412159-Pyramimonas_sp.AAC.2